MLTLSRWITVGALTLLLTACAIGPNYKPEPTLPAPMEQMTGKRVVVSGFVGSRYATSTTQSDDILTIRESIGTSDISPQIANILHQGGIAAEARAGFSQEMLEPDQVLLRGTMRISGGGGWDPGNGMNWANFVVCAGTLCVVGMILPTPVPWTAKVSVSYDVEVVDREGRFLAHSREQFTEAVFDNYWFWGVTNKNVNPTTFQHFT